MKFVKILAAVAALGFSVSASALSIEGSWDTLAGTTTGINSGNAENAWLESFGIDLSTGVSISVATIYSCDTGFCVSFGSATPEYFLVKLGVGQTGLNTHWLFTNVANLNYGAVNEFAGNEDFNNGRVSHIEIYGFATSVPEPASLALFGLGLLGLGVARRRAK